jgi:hypothetical protein
LLGGAADGAEESDWLYGDWTSKNAALGDVAVDFLANLERKFEQQAVVIVVCALVKDRALVWVDLVG